MSRAPVASASAAGWLDVGKRVWKKRAADNLNLLAAGVAFYAMLAIFPTIISLVTVYALVADPTQIAEQVEPVTSVLPPAAGDLLTEQLRSVADANNGGLTIGLIISLLAALWAASGGISALITGINAVYDQPEQRGFVKLKALALALTLGAIVVAGCAIALVAAFPAVVDALNLGTAGRVGAEALRWLVLAAIVSVALTVFYRVGPSRAAAPRWRTLVWGVGIALVIWLLGSVGFTLYVQFFGNYNKTYGALAAVVILMLWLFLSAYIVLLGAEVDAELERRAAEADRNGTTDQNGTADQSSRADQGSRAEHDERASH